MAHEKRLADIDALLEEIDRTIDIMEKRKDRISVRNVIVCVKNAPTVDAVEVVRCKDCKYYDEKEIRCDHPMLEWEVECYDHWLDVETSDFCSYGERREGE